MVYKLDRVEIKDLKGLFATMPWTMTGFVLAAFSIVGVPPTCGFFSKWYLILGAFEAGAWHFAAALLISSLICAVLFFKVFEVCFFESPDPHAGQGSDSHGRHTTVAIQEAPAISLAILGIAGISLIVVGLYSKTIVVRLIWPLLN
jgi:multicomponent Na+:H+ antiporter subunit D